MIDVDPTAVRAAWDACGQDAEAELRDARHGCRDAGAHTLDAVSATVLGAASDMAAVLDVALAVLEEHRVGMEECLTDYRNSDGNSAGGFDALRR